MSSSKHKILVINPNSNTKVTDLIQQLANRTLGKDCSALVINPQDSPLSIESIEDRKVAEPLVVDLLNQYQGYDAYVMACFDDIAIKSARALLSVPVIDSVEASISIAKLYGSRFSIVTTVEAMVPGIKRLVENLGASSQCTVRSAGIGVAAAAAGETAAIVRLDETIINARDIDGAKVIILGSGGLVGQASILSKKHGLPVLDCIESAIKFAEMAAK